MRRQTSYRRIDAELPVLGTIATTRSGEVGEVVGHIGNEAVIQFAGHIRGNYYPDEITWQVVGAQTEGKWQTEGAELHLADRDYPELGDILGKPAPAVVQEGNEWGRVASKTADGDGPCVVCGKPIDKSQHRWTSMPQGNYHDECFGLVVAPEQAEPLSSTFPELDGRSASAKVESCPNCHSAHIFVSGGQARPGTKGQQMCGNCFHTWDKTALKMATPAQDARDILDVFPEKETEANPKVTEVHTDPYRQGKPSKTASLNDKMDFDHVVQVLPGGQVVDAHGVYAPELYDDELQGQGWTLMDGYSGQSGYSGPIIHDSEFIGGGLERDILANPGYYVTLVNNSYDEEEGEGWGIAYKSASKASSLHIAWNIEDVRSSVEQGWYGQSGVDGTKIDQFSASALTQVYDALTPENQAKLNALPLEKAVDVAFKLIKRHSASKTAEYDYSQRV